MRLSFILLVLFPTVLFGTSTRVPIRVTAHVPLVATVDGPAQVELSPGERAKIRVHVLANVPWTLSIQSPNASAEQTVPLSGPPGGAPANDRDVEISCSPQAHGRQIISLVYTLMPQ